MKELESAIKAGRVHHDGNPMLTWMMSNVVAKTDAKDNIYPRKEKDEQKIDGPVAAIMGIARAISGQEVATSFWDKP
jgi:phage terminase large subunit-like protein